MSCTVDANPSIWQLTICGTLTNRDLFDLSKLVNGPSNDAPLAPRGLVDLRGLIELDVNFSRLHSTIAAVSRRKRHERVKRAIIAKSPIQYRLARTIELLVNRRQVEMQTFESEDDALRWVLNWPWCPLHSTPGVEEHWENGPAFSS
jgi:hypothetical protein